MGESRGISWESREIRTLISIWADPTIKTNLERKSVKGQRNAEIYKEIAGRMLEEGYERTPTQCRRKVKKLKEDFNKLAGTGSESRVLPGRLKPFRWYNHLVPILGAPGEAGVIKVEDSETDTEDIQQSIPHPPRGEQSIPHPLRGEQLIPHPLRGEQLIPHPCRGEQEHEPRGEQSIPQPSRHACMCSGEHRVWSTVIPRAMSSQSQYQFETLNVTKPKEYVLQVEINRPEKRNAMNKTFYREFVECFKQIAVDGDCRSVVLCGAGKMFTAGIDVMDLASQLMNDMDPGRKAYFIRQLVSSLQESTNILEKCPKPIIAAVHGGCIGAGVDTITACDMRFCTQDAYFQVKEVDIGIAADLGTLQRLPRVMGNDSLVRELCYTARKMMADEAKQAGLVSRIFPDRESLLTGAAEMGSLIASKSPVAVQGTKINLVFARDHSVPDGLEYVATWNQSMLQSEDVVKAATAALQKETPTFSKL